MRLFLSLVILVIAAVSFLQQQEKATPAPAGPKRADFSTYTSHGLRTGNFEDSRTIAANSIQKHGRFDRYGRAVVQPTPELKAKVNDFCESILARIFPPATPQPTARR